jgi:hypothetical protein
VVIIEKDGGTLMTARRRRKKGEPGNEFISIPVPKAAG